MNIKNFLVALVVAGLLGTAIVFFQVRGRQPSLPPLQSAADSSQPPGHSPPPVVSGGDSPPTPAAPPVAKPAATEAWIGVGTATNKAERLAQIREKFRLLAAGDPATAIRAAKQISDETERETALLALVTEWTQGELSSPRRRAYFISTYGLEAGLGLELVKYPELATLWANELTGKGGRNAILQQTAGALVATDPAAAFAMGDQVPQNDRNAFRNGVIASWAENDTRAALEWANQLSDPSERDGALDAIRAVAPVGIGAALTMRGGYPIIGGLVPGTPAQLSGQLHVGDRIVALARGDYVFVDVQGLPLQDVVQTIRGAPNTIIQLQVLPAGALPGSQPKIVSIKREQITYKR